jgi:hypothetical protein
VSTCYIAVTVGGTWESEIHAAVDRIKIVDAKVLFVCDRSSRSTMAEWGNEYRQNIH